MIPFSPLRRYHFRWSLMIAVAAVLVGVFLYVSTNVRIETDILASLPRHDPVLADAYRIIRHLPVQDRLIIDCEIRGGSRDDLVAGAELIESGLKKSGLFRQVGMEQMQTLMPELIGPRRRTPAPAVRRSAAGGADRSAPHAGAGAQSACGRSLAVAESGGHRSGRDHRP